MHFIFQKDFFIVNNTFTVFLLLVDEIDIGVYSKTIQLTKEIGI